VHVQLRRVQRLGARAQQHVGQDQAVDHRQVGDLQQRGAGAGPPEWAPALGAACAPGLLAGPGARGRAAWGERGWLAGASSRPPAARRPGWERGGQSPTLARGTLASGGCCGCCCDSLLVPCCRLASPLLSPYRRACLLPPSGCAPSCGSVWHGLAVGLPSLPCKARRPLLPGGPPTSACLGGWAAGRSTTRASAYGSSDIARP
jgi:hypothetical protein